MPKTRNLANRTTELDVFLKMAVGDYDCRIMLIDGETGMGKTSLLNKFENKCPHGIKYIPFDCKGIRRVSEFLSQIVADLGHDQFKKFLLKVKAFVHGGVDFSGNDIAAENTISIAINNGFDKVTQNYRLEQLQEAFFDDLSKINQRIVVTIDTYQLASEDLSNWIEGKWLRDLVRRLDNVVTIIAGQSIPAPNNTVWGNECEYFQLKAINDMEAWYEFCSELPSDAVKVIALSCKGNPKDFCQMLSLIKANW